MQEAGFSSHRIGFKESHSGNNSNEFIGEHNKLNQFVRIAANNPQNMKALPIAHHGHYLQRQICQDKGRRMMSPILRFGEGVSTQGCFKYSKMEVPSKLPNNDSPHKMRYWQHPIQDRLKESSNNCQIQPTKPFGERSKSPIIRIQNSLAKYRSLKELIKPPSPLIYTPKLPYQTEKGLSKAKVPNQPEMPEAIPIGKPLNNSTTDSTNKIRQFSIYCNGKVSNQIQKQCLKQTMSTMAMENSLKIHSRTPSNQLGDLNIPPPAPSIHDFEILKQIGKGRFSKVYKIRHKATGFMAALKLITKRQVQAEGLLHQIRRQIKIHNSIQHPHIIQFYACYQDHINIYIIFELGCDGQLYDKLSHIGHFSEQTTSVIIRNVLEAVAHLHHKRILHRDIKPENIVIMHGIAKLCDLGWSVNHSEGNLRQTVCGTPLYASPELLKGHSYDEKNDLWAVGILAYELFYGKIPFEINRGEELLKIVTEDIVFPKNTPISSSFRDFITTTLSKNPLERFDCDEMLRHPFITNFKDVEVCSELIGT